MKKRLCLLALFCLSLVFFVTVCGKSQDSSEDDESSKPSRKAMQVCSQCGRECPDGEKYCGECGGKVVKEEPPRTVCSQCGRECPDGEKFCGECGGKVVTERPDSQDGLTITLSGQVKLKLKKISAGDFLMGSPESEKGRFDGETQHRVSLTEDYWLGTFEVTQAQWKAVMGDNPSAFKDGGDYPVEQVSWEDAMAFCERLNRDPSIPKPKGYQFSLPTEAQWEYACRGGKRSSGCLYSGGDDCSEVAWYVENSGKERLRELDLDNATAEEIRAFIGKMVENGCQTHPCGGKSPNELGLYDMSGNVCEWCLDWYGDYNGKATDPQEPASGSCRVLRGGSWSNSARRCRSAYRDFNSPGLRYYFIGFRLALVPVQE